MIASLPMYDRPSNRAAHDVLWQEIRDELRKAGIAAPNALNRDIDYMEGWASPDLVVGQICNLPYRARFRGKVTLIGAADYGLPGCAPGYYNGVFIVPVDAASDDPLDYLSGRFACNDLLSNSGYGAPQLWAHARGAAITDPLMTGSHAASLDAVAAGMADMASLDHQTWRVLLADLPALAAAVRVIGTTDVSPGMTFITAKGQDPAPYFSAISAAIACLPQDARNTLGLQGIYALPSCAYDIPLPPAPQAKAASKPVLSSPDAPSCIMPQNEAYLPANNKKLPL